MLKLLTVLCLFVSVISSQAENSCQNILLKAGHQEDFGFNVGHAIHSLSLRTLRKFKKDVTENNRVPTINMDLASEEPILPYAPDRSTPDSQYFQNEGMRIVDEVLSHMDDSKYDLNGYSTLEKIAHAFHMEELWETALHNYKKFERDPPSQQVCNCALDIENNGILKQLHKTLLMIRGIRDDGDARAYQQFGVAEDGEAGRDYRFFGIGGEEEDVARGYPHFGGEGRAYQQFGVAEDGDTAGSLYPQEADDAGRDNYRFFVDTEESGEERLYPQHEVIGESNKVAPHDHLQKDDDNDPLVSQEAWKRMKTAFLQYKPNPIDTATFLYCALNDF